jgi:methyltransferase (TIGR00027 family)
MNDKGSVTALVTAFSRAYHSTYAAIKILDDFLAIKMFSEEVLPFFEKSIAESLKFLDPELATVCESRAESLEAVMRIQNAPVTLSRSRYTEDRLGEAVSSGVRQYVILGAGMDTFAFREPELMKRLDVFEVDHPATQTAKRQRITELGWEIPDSLHFVPQDFAVESLGSALERTNYEIIKPTFFSWLGVVCYLNRETVFDMLRTFADISAPGSIIVFDYFDLDAFDPDKAGKRVRKMQEMVRNAGEPMKTGFDPAKVVENMDLVGLELLEDLRPAEIEERYFKGRDDGYHAYEHVHFAMAQVK